jgi:hypothetical protein
MPVAMTTPSDPKPEQTEQSTEDLPAIPTVQEMETWDDEKLLRWIQQRNRNILKYDDLDNFNQARITGAAFLGSSFEFLNKFCCLSPAVSLGLVRLVDEVKEGKFIPWT